MAQGFGTHAADGKHYLEGVHAFLRSVGIGSGGGEQVANVLVRQPAVLHVFQEAIEHGALAAQAIVKERLLRLPRHRLLGSLQVRGTRFALRQNALHLRPGQGTEGDAYELRNQGRLVAKSSSAIKDSASRAQRLGEITILRLQAHVVAQEPRQLAGLLRGRQQGAEVVRSPAEMLDAVGHIDKLACLDQRRPRALELRAQSLALLRA